MVNDLVKRLKMADEALANDDYHLLDEPENVRMAITDAIAALTARASERDAVLEEAAIKIGFHGGFFDPATIEACQETIRSLKGTQICAHEWANWLGVTKCKLCDATKSPSQPVAKECEDCPPVGYPTDETRCDPCPRRSATSAPAPQGLVEETAWVIERADSPVSAPVYYSLESRTCWAPDHLLALRFARKKDAQNYADAIIYDGIKTRVCKHVWCSSISTQQMKG